jgi:hypothetical protein
MLVWQHGEGLSYTDEFLGSFVGRGESDIDGVPNVSGATGTAGNFKAAVASVIDFYKLVKGGV